MRWRLLRRRPPRRPPGVAIGNGREREAIEKLRRTELASERTEELIVRGELLANRVRRALGGYQ